MSFLSFAQQYAHHGALPFRRAHEVQDRPEEYAEKAAEAVPADVRMLSGCQDAQTSADVSNVAAFGLPPHAGPGGAGGACTNAFLASIYQAPQPTWVALLESMRQVLKSKGYTQVPEMSASRQINLSDRFEVDSDGGGRKRALLVGINYVGQQGELHGCANDVRAMQQWLQTKGFSEFHVLTDGGFGDGQPTAKGILEGFQWLANGAKAGDSLFFHYSGHGASVPDTSGDEKDGKDETIVPVDFQSAGMISDDIILKSLVLPLPQGCQLTAVMDCCHSGTVLDLPYMFTANDQNMNHAQTTINNGGQVNLPINGNFNLQFALKLAMQLFQAYQQGGMDNVLKAGLNSFFH